VYRFGAQQVCHRADPRRCSRGDRPRGCD
jgi:hypothetical protein